MTAPNLSKLSPQNPSKRRASIHGTGGPQPSHTAKRLMAAITYVCSVTQVARLLGEDAELLEAIVSNEDNMTYGNIVSVHIAHEDYITALTDDGIQEIKDMLKWARVSKDTWHNFLEDFVGDPEIIARVKNQPPR